MLYSGQINSLAECRLISRKSNVKPKEVSSKSSKKDSISTRRPSDSNPQSTHKSEHDIDTNEATIFQSKRDKETGNMEDFYEPF
jgi:hypothetical protein